MPFDNELKFEDAVVEMLGKCGWEKEVLINPSEEDLIANWARILFNNNRQIDRLNNVPLSSSEMSQIIRQVEELRTPLKLNNFINGKTVTIKRENIDDKLHYGKEVSLKIYDPREIAAGQSRYQIVRQPRFKTPGLFNDRRGDVMLLINGMPLFHIELKRTGIPVSQAANQMAKYSREKVYRGIFSLVQIMVAMNPEDAVYFANPGEDNPFNPNYFFHWADTNNEPIKEWNDVILKLLSIPMAHELIGFYTVSDNTEGLLKVMRSYQYHAARAISDSVSKTDWSVGNKLGGYIWHTTGSGKTLTSFKSAQLIADSQDADKVLFLVDRIELGTQSLRDYRNFAGDSLDIQETENTHVLVTKLKSSNPQDILIVTSIQKMSNIQEEADGLKTKDLELMKSKRIVFIIDECHRSTFGTMLQTIKQTFPQALFFGFTGTPILDENGQKNSTTSDVFGNELHRYSIADGIRDKNVLGFDPYKVLTFADEDIKNAVALEKAKCSTIEEVFSDSEKTAVYYEYFNRDMPSKYIDSDGKEVKGIESFIPSSQYREPSHQNAVVDNIIKFWKNVSYNSKFHAIFATSSIKEAIQYYNIFNSRDTDLKISALFDPNIDNVDDDKSAFKSEGLMNIIQDYNLRYGQPFNMGSFEKYRKDVALRLAHKKPYTNIDKTPEKQIDILIVVNQMLTGFDSKWVNTLYVDKNLEYENIIQAFSRTNRLFGNEKPFGTIKYFRYPHTMEKNIENAVKLYSGDKPLGLFVDKIQDNIIKINNVFRQLKRIFPNDFSRLPPHEADRSEFAKLFRELNNYFEAAKIQGFDWKNNVNSSTDNLNIVELTEFDYNSLLLRYKELPSTGGGEGTTPVPYDLDSYLIQIKTGEINNAYMNNNFVKYLKSLNSGDKETTTKLLKDLHSSFANLTSEEQKYANIFLRDVERGEVQINENKTFRDYVTEYLIKAKNTQINICAEIFGLDEAKLKILINRKLNSDSINEFGKFEELKKSVDKEKTKQYFERIEKTNIKLKDVNHKVDSFLRKFIISGGFEIKLE